MGSDMTTSEIKQAELVAECGQLDSEVMVVVQDNWSNLIADPAPAVAQEPVGEIAEINGCPVVYWDKSLPVGTKFYTEAPAVAVNEQMYNALKMVMDDPQSLEGRPRTFECVTEAIGAYEAAKKGSEM